MFVLHKNIFEYPTTNQIKKKKKNVWIKTQGHKKLAKKDDQNQNFSSQKKEPSVHLLILINQN